MKPVQANAEQETYVDDTQSKEWSKYVQVTPEEAAHIARTLYRYDNIAGERVGRLDDIGEGQVTRYKDQGYVIVESVLQQSEIDTALQEIDDIIQGRMAGPKVQRIKPNSEPTTPEQREFATRKIYNYVDYAPALRHIAYHEDILATVRKLLGDEPKLIDEQGLLKPPYGGGEKPWHQDMAYGGLFYKKQIVTVWIALDAADLDNGCMHLIPRSHLAGGAPHYAIRDWQICDHHVNVEHDVAAVIAPGGALFFSGLLWHGTPANFSAKRRRALQLRYAPASSALMSKEQFQLMFTSSMTDAEC
ncbi:phytanoyl-CoA dioxygenase family protein [Paenibacillus hodogayensis]|uniref:Phytanoyl-CoA dioxygenase family protein n=1 Tax=Paenibacillus hodogayensis TaxID=279208 RepID=A0ABV5W2K5_9BACL